VYDIKWEIYDAKSGQIVWATTSHGKNTSWWKIDENPDERASVLLDGFLNEIRSDKLI